MEDTTPLRRLGRTLERRRPHDLQPLALDGAPSEMVPMMDALTGLFGRIGELVTPATDPFSGQPEAKATPAQ